MYKSVMISIYLIMSITNLTMASSIGANETYTTVVDGFSIEVTFEKINHGFAVMSKFTRMENAHTVNASIFLKPSDRATINLGFYFRENDVPLTNLGLLLINDENHLTVEVGHIVSDNKFVKVHADI